MESEDRSLVRRSAFTWVWALCLALVLRALVPAGYMPDFASSDLPTVSLCGMQTPELRGVLHSDHSSSASAYDNPLHFVAQCLGSAPLPVVASAAGAAFLSFFVVFLIAAITPRVSRVRSSPLGSRAPPRSFA